MFLRNLLLSLLLVAGLASASEWALVGNPSLGLSSVSKADLKRLYTGKRSQIGSTKVVPILLVESNPAAAAFLAEVLGMTPAEYKKYWVDAQIRGEGTAPMTQKSSMAAAAVVGDLPGGIAVVERSAVGPGVKVIEVR